MFESINAPTRPNWILRIAFAAVIDTPDKLDFDKMARVVDGVRSAVVWLANQP